MIKTTFLRDQDFLPWRSLEASAEPKFFERRNRLYSLCSPDEQRCLGQVAGWREARGPSPQRKPDLLTRFARVVIHRRYQLGGRPSLIVRALARATTALLQLKERRGQRFQTALISRLSRLRRDVDDDALLGTIHFLRLLPLDTGVGHAQYFVKALDQLTAELVATHRVSAERMFAAAQRCIQWGRALNRYRSDSGDLGKHLWQLLLEVAQEDIAAAVRLVDEHWQPSPSSRDLSEMLLYERPELACQLALKLKPHRLEFAVAMLGRSLDCASFQLTKLEPPALAQLETVMDGSCRVLAEWILSSTSALPPAEDMHAMQRLFQFSNPKDPHWERLPREAISLLQRLPATGDAQQLALIAAAAFYAPAPLAAEALKTYTHLVAHRFDGSSDGNRLPWGAVRDACNALSILEEKAMSFRNRRIAAAPDHPLLHSLERLLLNAQARLLANAPSHGLENIVSLTLELSNQDLIRRQHRFLRNEFEARARSAPKDAGLALKALVSYCGYSQMDDEMYCKHLCKETFDALLPVLAALSPDDAAVARSGIGWSPRRDI